MISSELVYDFTNGSEIRVFVGSTALALAPDPGEPEASFGIALEKHRLPPVTPARQGPTWSLINFTPQHVNDRGRRKC